MIFSKLIHAALKLDAEGLLKIGRSDAEELASHRFLL